jgi:hypothetical protein
MIGNFIVYKLHFVNGIFDSILVKYMATVRILSSLIGLLYTYLQMQLMLPHCHR